MEQTTETAEVKSSNKMDGLIEEHVDKMNEYSVTLFEACEMLSRSGKTLSRYIRQGRIAPKRIKSQQGTLEYRFRKDDLETLRISLREDTADTTQNTEDMTQNASGDRNTHEQTEQTAHSITDKTGQNEQSDKTRNERQDIEIEAVLKEITKLLKDQLAIKDNQIATLNEQIGKHLERDRETNILLKGLQDRIILLEPPKQNFIEAKTGQSRVAMVRQAILSVLFFIVMGFYFYITHVK